MGLIKNLMWWWIFQVTCLFADSETANYYDDSVVLEVADGAPSREGSVASRSIYLPYFQYFQSVLPLYAPYSPAFKYSSYNSESCLTSTKDEGRCLPFKTCYPRWNPPDMQYYDMWINNMLDRCTYVDVDGQQSYGVCCTNTAENLTRIVTPDEKATNEDYRIPGYPSWPPPLPTHPPDHTIPPLPTHPPSLGFPGFTTEKTTRFPINGKPRITDISCGAKSAFTDQERIVGGQNADIGEWPWIAALFNNGRQFCGGSLIDNSHILTAAHCVAHMSSWDVARLTIRLGDYNIRTNSETRHLELRAKRVVRHRGFDSRTLYNDIAIITLDNPVQFNKKIRPICLPSSGANFAGRAATVIGWGSLREGGPQPSILQKVNIPIWSNADCRAKYGPAAPGGIVDHMLCAGNVAKDSCSGDSGGPLMVYNSGRWTQAGIVSWGIGCGKGNYPGVYTKVDRFLPWIYKNMKN
ncbi:serine protease 33-like [Agrilus planipennis]|uniref:Phenoloxidase-activating factor 2 n=1 Tax=Agrilus planipennis TaxID=224129 RepID=A0A1W4WRG0_AGRPL|nr:serine protease 33-like [Agrilus planipennis]